MKLSLSQLSNLESKYTSAKKSVQRVREEAQATVMQVVRTVEVGGAAFSFGIVNGRWGRPELVGVPVDLLTSIGLHGLGFVLDKKRRRTCTTSVMAPWPPTSRRSAPASVRRCCRTPTSLRSPPLASHTHE